jgi:apolipoprotein N-acyltransferase
LGLLCGFAYFAGTVYWTGDTVRTFGGLPAPVAALVAGLLIAYLALFVGAAGAISGLMVRRFGARGLLMAPLAWVATEYLRGHLFGGFPWIPLGNAVVSLTPVAQLASVAGVYGLSLLLVLVNVGFTTAMVTAGRRRSAALASTAGLVLAVSLWGASRVTAGALLVEGEPVRVAVVQGNIPQEDKWNPSRAGDILHRYVSLTRAIARSGVDLIIWPESATPFYFDEDPARAAIVREVVRETGTPLLFGTDEIERGSPDRYFNSAFMLDRAGTTAAVYRKIHLVPFGEYVPLQQALFFVAPLVEAVSNFSPGTRITMLPAAGHMLTTAICYEVVYPHLIREGVLQGSELLTTVTNDAWYGTSSAPFQHFDLAAMRAIEQGRYLARAANTGISGFVDPYGRVLARTALFETTSLVAELRFLQSRTVYARIGDLVAQLAILVTLMSIAAAYWRS